MVAKKRNYAKCLVCFPWEKNTSIPKERGKEKVATCIILSDGTTKVKLKEVQVKRRVSLFLRESISQYVQNIEY